MNVGLDTSVLVRLLVGEPVEQFKRAEAHLDELHRRGGQAIVSDFVAAETYFALQYHYDISKADALRFLKDAFASGEVQGDGVAAEILKEPQLASVKPGFIDRIIHAQYLRNAAEVLSFEKSAAKLKSVRVI